MGRLGELAGKKGKIMYFMCYTCQSATGTLKQLKHVTDGPRKCEWCQKQRYGGTVQNVPPAKSSGGKTK